MIDYESDYICEVGVDVDECCKQEATRVTHEPFTPGHFEILCCDEHAASLIRQGYYADREADKRLAESKRREAEYEYREEMDKQMTEAERLGESRIMR